MEMLLHRKPPFLSCRMLRVLLALFWLFGLLLGVLLSLSAETFISVSSIFSQCNLSLFCILSAFLLPLLITALSVCFSQPVLLLVLAFLKATLLSFVGMEIIGAFNVSGWLVCCFLMISNFLSLPVLWLVWLRSICDNRSSMQHLFIPAIVIMVVVCCIDYFLISPYFISLL